MSPRRRLALALLAVAAVLLVVLPLAVTALRRHDQAVSVPAVDQGRPGTVLLVAGYGGGTQGLGRLAAALRQAGRSADVVPVAGDGTGDLRRQAAEIDATARSYLASGSPSVDVVGYSAGGVVVRLWLAGAGADVPVRRVVTLGSPHQGTDLADQAAGLGDACPQACRQLQPGSDLLASLPATPGSPRWTSVWSESDDVVIPPRRASTLPGALDVDLQGICPGAVAHGDLPTTPLVVGVVDAALDAAPLGRAPSASACASLVTRGRALLDG